MQFRTLAKAIVLPATILTLLEFVPDNLNPALALILWLGTIALYTLVAITTHRIILLGPHSVPEWGLSRWTTRESYFLFHTFALVLIMFAASLLTFIPVVGAIAALAAYFWVFARISLVFPAIALDQALTFPMAWAMTRNHQGLVVLTVGLFPLAFGLILYSPIMLITFLLPPPATAIAVKLLTVIPNILLLVISIAALSVTYREITAQPKEPETSAR